MKKLTVGMIGVAHYGAYRREQMRASGRFNLVAVCARKPDVMFAVAEEENAQPYSDFDAMLDHPGLEAVVISTSADSHSQYVITALRRGLHVFVEKPLCCSTREIEELRQAVRETGKVVGVGHDHCATDPLLLAAKQHIEEGRLGTVAAFEENSSHSGGLEIKPGDWRGLADRNPGGMLFQCGVHAFHSLSFLFGPVQSVQAMMRYDANPNTQTADAANVLLRCANGMVGTLNCYHVTAYCHELRIFGSKGNLYFDTYRHVGWFQERKRGEVEEREPLAIPKAAASHAYANLVSWHDAIRTGTAPYPGLEDGINAVLPVFAAERAAQEGKEVKVAELM